jgi:hypothetical protein
VHTVATFIFGKDMTVTANGKTEVVTRVGWQVVTYAGAAPGAPQQAPTELLKTELGKLEGAPGGSTAADEKAKTLDQGGPGGTAPLNPAIIDQAAGALSDSNVQQQKQVLPPPTPPTPGPRLNR